MHFDDKVSLLLQGTKQNLNGRRRTHCSIVSECSGVENPCARVVVKNFIEE